MTIAKPIARPLIVGLLILAALLVYAAMSARVALAPSLPSITFPHQTQTESRENTGTSKGQSTQATQSSADAVQKPSGSGTPVDSAGGSGSGIQRFADAGPDVVGPAAAQTVQSCSPKPCPRPQR